MVIQITRNLCCFETNNGVVSFLAPVDKQSQHAGRNCFVVSSASSCLVLQLTQFQKCLTIILTIGGAGGEQERTQPSRAEVYQDLQIYYIKVRIHYV